MRVPVRPQPLYLLESQLGPGGDDQVIVVDRAAIVQFDLVFFRVHPFGPDADEIDFFLRQQWSDFQFYGVTFAPVHRYPRVGGHEVELWIVGDHRHLVAGTNAFTHFIGHRHATEARPENHDMSHVNFLFHE